MVSRILAAVPVQNLVCHVDVRCIFDMWTVSYESKRYRNVSTEFLLLVQKVHPVHVVKLDGETYGFFCGWDLVVEFRERGIDSIEVIIHESLSSNEIYRWALSSEIGKAFHLPGAGYAPYRYLHDLFDRSLHEAVEFSGCPRPRTALRAVMTMCDLTRPEARVRVASSKFALSDLEIVLRGRQAT